MSYKRLVAARSGNGACCTLLEVRAALSGAGAAFLHRYPTLPPRARRAQRGESAAGPEDARRRLVVTAVLARLVSPPLIPGPRPKRASRLTLAGFPDFALMLGTSVGLVLRAARRVSLTGLQIATLRTLAKTH